MTILLNLSYRNSFKQRVLFSLKEYHSGPALYFLFYEPFYEASPAVEPKNQHLSPTSNDREEGG